jgi:hypothetical protein
MELELHKLKLVLVARAGDVAESIGRTRLAGLGLLTTGVRGGIFRELLVCSTQERWWSCVPEELVVQCASCFVRMLLLCAYGCR